MDRDIVVTKAAGQVSNMVQSERAEQELHPFGISSDRLKFSRPPPAARHGVSGRSASISHKYPSILKAYLFSFQRMNTLHVDI